MNKAEALIYIYGYLEGRWDMTHDDELQKILGDIAPDGHQPGEDKLYTADPAAWDDWEKAIEKVTYPDYRGEISIDHAYQAIIELMNEYNKQGFRLDETITYLKQKIWGGYSGDKNST